LRLNGDYKEAIALLERMARKLNVSSTNKGRAFVINLRSAVNLMSLGELNKAEGHIKRNATLLSEARTWENGKLYLSSWEGAVEEGNARLLYARGRFSEAENAYRKAEVFYRDAMVKSRSWPILRPQGGFESGIDYMTAFGARAKGFQGRHAEAENDVRRALLSRLNAVGKYHADTANMLNFFSELLLEQNRAKESEALARASLEIYDAVGYRRDTSNYVYALNKLATALFAQRRFRETKEAFATMDVAVQSWLPERQTSAQTTWTRIYTHYYIGEVDKGIETARASYERVKTIKGEQHYDTVLTRAMLATGLAFAKRDDEAMQEYGTAVPMLLGATSEADDEDATVTLYADRRLQTVLETYIAVLARSNVPNRAEESFRLAEAIRSRSVQNALAASAARAAARTPELAEVVRKQQDLHKQVLAQAALLNNILAEPPEQRQAGLVKDVQQELDTVRKAEQAAKREIQRRFPQYASLTKPTLATANDIRAALRPDEALLSFYFSNRGGFVWALPKTGPIAFAQLPITAPELEKKVSAVRGALDLNMDSIADIQAFDVASAHALYKLLLEPIEQAWRPAKTLVVVTNGALGLLPLGMLPIKPPEVATPTAGEPYFASYRKVQWLARTHATVSLPSAEALRTLRSVAEPTAKREQLVGFGDPFFNREQADEDTKLQNTRATENESRGVKIKLRATPRTLDFRSANLGQLPRLPDTADELRSIALALQADPAKILHLGKDANEKTVKSLDLSRYRIVVFSTHGLMPGDLDGLTQPALALTAPDVAHIDGDGLLTVDEILGLKLNADWVVLSACNTAAGAGAGAEAVSGLGRAFFYAGSRALLVTNWSVHSESARDLVTDVFRRQADNPKLGRAEALRQAMMALLDGAEMKDQAGRTLYTYAHPLFWAPYTIMGDGG
jgi:CHAT domain-containing protein